MEPIANEKCSSGAASERVNAGFIVEASGFSHEVSVARVDATRFYKALAARVVSSRDPAPP
jgi:hypothetical protein